LSAKRIPGQATTDFTEIFDRLTGRDEAIIDALARHRVLTSTMLSELFFPSGWAARARVLTLYEMGVLARFRDHNRSEYRYTLGYWGAGVHALRKKQTPPTKKAVAAEVHRLAVSRHRPHLEGVNAFFARLTSGARAHGGLAVKSWLCEEEASALFLGKVRPDGAAELVTAAEREPFFWEDDARKQLPFFFEHDTGTETLNVLIGKLGRYAAKRPAGGHRAVLLQLTRRGREENLHRRLAAVHYPFLVATTSEKTGVLGTIWRVHGRIGKFHLTELMSHGGRL
jgi:hypothetical protein